MRLFFIINENNTGNIREWNRNIGKKVEEEQKKMVQICG